jgi:cytochrome c553
MERTMLGAALVALTAFGAMADGDAAAGRKKARQCGARHGIDGMAKIPIAPNIGGENLTYLKTQLQSFRSGKRGDEIMSIAAKGLSDRDIDDPSAWYSSISATMTAPK